MTQGGRPGAALRLTRRYRFSASHRLHAPALPDSENRRVFGKCNNPFGHGHDYLLDVTVEGPLDSETGRVVDLERLDALVREKILEPFEHKNLNTDVPEFSKIVPTSENVAIEAGRRLRAAWAGVFGRSPALERVRVYETRRNIFELSYENE